VKKPYQIRKQDSRADEALQRFTQANGQFLLPLVELIEQSAELIAGPRTPGKSSGEVRWHGSQRGRVELAERDVAVERPRLRHKRQGEVVYRDDKLSTPVRKYSDVLCGASCGVILVSLALGGPRSECLEQAHSQ